MMLSRQRQQNRNDEFGYRDTKYIRGGLDYNQVYNLQQQQERHKQNIQQSVILAISQYVANEKNSKDTVEKGLQSRNFDAARIEHILSLKETHAEAQEKAEKQALEQAVQQQIEDEIKEHEQRGDYSSHLLAVTSPLVLAPSPSSHVANRKIIVNNQSVTIKQLHSSVQKTLDQSQDLVQQHVENGDFDKALDVQSASQKLKQSTDDVIYIEEAHDHYDRDRSEVKDSQRPTALAAELDYFLSKLPEQMRNKVTRAQQRLNLSSHSLFADLKLAAIQVQQACGQSFNRCGFIGRHGMPIEYSLLGNKRQELIEDTHYNLNNNRFSYGRTPGSVVSQPGQQQIDNDDLEQDNNGGFSPLISGGTPGGF